MLRVVLMRKAKYEHNLFSLLKKYKSYKKTEFRTIGDKLLDFTILLSAFFTATLIILTIGVIVLDI